MYHFIFQEVVQMRSIAEILHEIEKLDKNKNKLVWQQRFLYPLFFQDDLYAIAYNYSLNKMKLKKIENSNLGECFSFLTLKRLINRMRLENNKNESPIDIIKNYKNSHTVVMLNNKESGVSSLPDYNENKLAEMENHVSKFLFNDRTVIEAPTKGH